jgi:hypothetical protein
LVVDVGVPEGGAQHVVGKLPQPVRKSERPCVF